MFLAGSLMVGALTRSAARKRARVATANLQPRLRLSNEVAREKEITSELATEKRSDLGAACEEDPSALA
jgi:hypothetical protein